MFQFLLFMNLSVGVFNMAPGFPMDGGRILRSILWGAGGDYRRATFLASWCGRIMAYGMIFLGLAATVDFIDWLSPATGLWLVLLGFFWRTLLGSWLRSDSRFLRDTKCGLDVEVARHRRRDAASTSRTIARQC
jgi:Zn-dependent protease